MRKLLFFLFACLVTASSWAVPARRSTFTVTQPDGTVITLQLVGDEHFHYFRNVDTGEAMMLGADGQYTPIGATDLAARSKAAQTRRAAANARRQQRLAPRRATTGPNRVGGITPMSGAKKGLVILVNYSDKSMQSGRQAAFNSMFNTVGYSQGGHVGSVRDYFLDQSYGRLTIDFDVVGPVTVSQPMSYYGSNDSSKRDAHPAEMVIEACRLADKLGVDFSKYDWNGDGEVDQVYVIYAGYGEAAGGADETIWPHEWDLSSAASYGDGTGSLRLDGKIINTYACSAELCGGSGSTISPIGTACHEFSHCLGFPDCYDVDYSGAFGMDAWDIMDMGSYNGPSGYGEVPSGYTAYERWQAGWLEPYELTSAKTVKQMPGLGDLNADASADKAYVLYNPSNRNEYILLENRQPEKWFSYIGSNTASGGLLATHVDYDASAWANNTVNDTPDLQRMTIIPAGKTFGTYSSRNKQWSVTESQYRGMLFGNGTSVLDATSHASYNGKWRTSTADLGHSFTEMAHSGGLASFKYDGGEPEDDGSRYSVTFDAGTGTCSTTTWTQSSFGEGINLPRATAPSDADGYTFIGWSETIATGSKPATIYSQGSYYIPMQDVTLYAVYKNGTGGTSATGSYTLDYSKETELQGKTYAYTKEQSYTALDGSTWGIKAFKDKTTAGLQLNKGKSAYIKVPACPDYITSINIIGSTTAVLMFDASASNTSAPAAKGDAATSVTLDLTGKNLKTGYIFTTEGVNVISKIVVHYGADDLGGGSSTTYMTNPGGTTTTKPNLSFPATTKTMYVGDYDATFTAHSNSTGNITYTSNDPTVATANPLTGAVKALKDGQVVVTATQAAAGNYSYATAKYTLTVERPTLTSIYLTQQPTKTTYVEGESFSTKGMEVRAKYHNDYSEVLENNSLGYSYLPSGPLGTDDTKVTISYTEGGVTKTLDVAISVEPLPMYTVTFNPGGGACNVKSRTEVRYGTGVTMPWANPAHADWAFVGWAEAPINDTTDERPVVYAWNATYKPTADITLYAVYVHQESTGGSGHYERVATEPDDWSGDYVIASADPNGQLYFADGRLGGSSAEGSLGHANVRADVTYYQSDDFVEATSGDVYHVTVEKSNGKYVLKTQDGKYNYCKYNTGTSKMDNGIGVSDNVADAEDYPLQFAIDAEQKVTMKSSTATFFLNRNPSTSDTYFRFYANATTSTSSEKNLLRLYRKHGTVISVSYTSYPTFIAPQHPDHLELAELPTKTTYVEGETFDPTGMFVRLLYTNGTSRILPASEYTVLPDTPLTTANTEVQVIYSDGTFTCIYNLPITVLPVTLYTLTLDPGAGTCTTTSLTEASYQSGVVLPEAAAPSADWTFYGWAEAAVSTATTEEPTIVKAGQTYSLTADATLYAVYTRSAMVGGAATYMLVEEAPADWSGDYIIAPLEADDDDLYIYVANGATGGTSGIGAASSSVDPDEAGYDADNDCFSADKADPYRVTIEKSGGQYFFKTQDGKYNYLADQAQGAGISTSADITKATPVTFAFNDWSDVRILTAGGAYTFAFNSGNGNTYFRYYKNSSATAYINAGRTISLYKRQGGSLVVTYATYPAELTTIGALCRVIALLSSGEASLDDVNTTVNRILEK